MAKAISSSELTASYRWAVASRAMAAIFGGYILTVIMSDFTVALLYTYFDFSTAQAVFNGMSLSFLYYMLIAITIFSVSTASRAWLWLLGGSVVFAGLSFLIDGGIPS